MTATDPHPPIPTAPVRALTDPAAPLSVSVVVPIYNEIENIPRLYDELSRVLRAMGRDYEILCVDDGSTDGSAAALAEIAARDPAIKVIVFRRNYGQTSAMMAGIRHASMGAVVTIDGDLQNDPADIPMMLETLEQGYDLVHGWRKDRQDALISRKIPSRLANGLISRVTRFPIHDLGCTLKAMRREIVQEIELYGAMHRFIPILMFQRGARCIEVATNHRARVAGTSKYGIMRTFTVLLDLITVKYMLDYSAHPMRLFGGLALIAWAVMAVAFVAMLAAKLLWGADMTGSPLLLLSVTTGLAGLQLLTLGLLGEVSARIYFGGTAAGGQGRTHYAIRSTVNLTAG